jgi:3-dehydroquinate synthase class II
MHAAAAAAAPSASAADPGLLLLPAQVGRVKIEARPLVLVEARTADGQLHSVLLQNAETVKLVGLASGAQVGDLAAAVEEDGGDKKRWRAISVTEMQAGEQVLVLRQGGARHTGISIQESIVEK